MHFLFTLGFHADHAIRQLARARDIETITIATADPLVKAVEKAYKEIVAFTDRAGMPHPALLTLPVHDPPAAVEKLVDHLWTRTPLVADLSGGMRAVVVLALVAIQILAAKGHRVQVHVTTETSEAHHIVVDMETVTTILKGTMTPTRQKIAEEIAKMGEATPPTLAQTLQLTERTIRQHLAWLRNHSFLTEKRETYKPTPWLRLYTRLWRKT